MTICIASVCKKDDKNIFVIATDHMIDVGIGQFEHDIRKHKRIGNNIAMLSGSALMFNELINEINANNKFSEIRDSIYNNFIKLRKDIVQKQLLNKFDLNEKEIKEIVMSDIKNPIIAKLIDSIAKLKLDTNILLVGFENGKARISEIQENGHLDFTDIHFHAIGSGQVQAINTLMFQRQSSNDSLKNTIYNVYKAKRNAEVSSGVGKETDMLILSENEYSELLKEDMDILSKIYENELHSAKNSEDLNKLNVFINYDTRKTT